LPGLTRQKYKSKKESNSPNDPPNLRSKKSAASSVRRTSLHCELQVVQAKWREYTTE
jgi:hypothetical protein